MNIQRESMTFGLKELIYIIVSVAGIGGLYAQIAASDSRQSAQIDSLIKGRDENREAIVTLQREIGELRTEVARNKELLLEHDKRETANGNGGRR